MRIARPPSATARAGAFAWSTSANVSALGFGDLQAASEAAGVTEFLRPEDGASDTQDPNRFYFVTTDRFDTVKTGSGTQAGRTRLWRLLFQDVRTLRPAGASRCCWTARAATLCSTT
jgi:hypothetical protein